MFKNTTNSSRWVMYDTERNPYNISTDLDELAANASNAEDTMVSGDKIDILSNGFKFRNAENYEINVSNNTYIFIAFAETPAKFSTAR